LPGHVFGKLRQIAGKNAFQFSEADGVGRAGGGAVKTEDAPFRTAHGGLIPFRLQNQKRTDGYAVKASDAFFGINGHHAAFSFNTSFTQ